MLHKRKLETAMVSIYRPIDSSNSEIRLFKFHINPDGAIHGSLLTTNLSEDPRFSALSYTWGDASVTEGITVEGQSLAVTVNLAYALRHITKHWKSSFPEDDTDSFLLWTDAVCINQADLVERGRQVRLMEKIYSSAEIVFSWLGNDDELTNIGIESLELIARETSNLPKENKFTLEWMKGHPSLYEEDWEPPAASDPIRNKRWSGILHLFALNYWQRIWVFQEIVLASNLIMCSASRAMSYLTVDKAVETFVEIEQALGEGDQQCPDFLRDSSLRALALSEVRLSRKILGITRVKELHRCSKDTNLYKRRIAFETSTAASRLLAKDPKDYIYGVNSLMRFSLVPDYTEEKTVSDVYREYVSIILAEFSRAPSQLDAIMPLWPLRYCGLGLYKNKLGLPSWAPNYPEESMGGEPATLRREKFLTMNWNICPTDTPYPCVSGSILQVSGVVADQLLRTESFTIVDSFKNGLMLRYLTNAIARYSGNEIASGEMPPLQKMVRTLALECDCISEQTELTLACQFLACLTVSDSENHAANFQTLGLSPMGSQHNDRGADFNSTFIQSFCPTFKGPARDWEGQIRALVENKDAINHLEHLLARRMYRWRLIQTNGGTFGLGPPGARSGDLICVIHGSAFPLLLRREASRLMHVGLCHVVDFMQGEFTKKLKSGELDIQALEIF